MRLSLTIVDEWAAYFDAMHVDLIPFLALAVLLIVMPGPDTAMVTKNALVGGRRSGMTISRIAMARNGRTSTRTESQVCPSR